MKKLLLISAFCFWSSISLAQSSSTSIPQQLIGGNYYLPLYTISTLPTSPITGMIIWCSDCKPVYGTAVGDILYWNTDSNQWLNFTGKPPKSE